MPTTNKLSSALARWWILSQQWDYIFSNNLYSIFLLCVFVRGRSSKRKKNTLHNRKVSSRQRHFSFGKLFLTTPSQFFDFLLIVSCYSTQNFLLNTVFFYAIEFPDFITLSHRIAYWWHLFSVDMCFQMSYLQ